MTNWLTDEEVDRLETALGSLNAFNDRTATLDAKLLAWIRRHRRVVIMCGCPNWHTCEHPYPMMYPSQTFMMAAPEADPR